MAPYPVFIVCFRQLAWWPCLPSPNQQACLFSWVEMGFQIRLAQSSVTDRKIRSPSVPKGRRKVCKFEGARSNIKGEFIDISMKYIKLYAISHGLLNIWTELLYLTFPHEADILTLIMSHKLTQHL